MALPILREKPTQEIPPIAKTADDKNKLERAVDNHETKGKDPPKNIETDQGDGNSKSKTDKKKLDDNGDEEHLHGKLS